MLPDKRFRLIRVKNIGTDWKWSQTHWDSLPFIQLEVDNRHFASRCDIPTRSQEWTSEIYWGILCSSLWHFTRTCSQGSTHMSKIPMIFTRSHQPYQFIIGWMRRSQKRVMNSAVDSFPKGLAKKYKYVLHLILAFLLISEYEPRQGKKHLGRRRNINMCNQNPKNVLLWDIDCFAWRPWSGSKRSLEVACAIGLSISYAGAASKSAAAHSSF